jgi:hypothetical protein
VTERLRHNLNSLIEYAREVDRVQGEVRSLLTDLVGLSAQSQALPRAWQGSAVLVAGAIEAVGTADSRLTEASKQLEKLFGALEELGISAAR